MIIILRTLYGRLNPPNRGQVAGSLKSFDQALYIKTHQPDALSLGDTGYVFVPLDCEQGGPSKVVDAGFTSHCMDASRTPATSADGSWTTPATMRGRIRTG